MDVTGLVGASPAAKTGTPRQQAHHGRAACRLCADMRPHAMLCKEHECIPGNRPPRSRAMAQSMPAAERQHGAALASHPACASLPQQ